MKIRMALMGMTVAVLAVFEVSPVFAQKQNAQKCEAIYQKYPIQRCRHSDGACFQRNAENREKRQAAGCKPNRDYQS